MKSLLTEIFRLRIVGALSSMFFFQVSFAQITDQAPKDDTLYYYTYIPKYEWSVGIEHSYIPAVFTTKSYCPDNFEIAFWVNQRLYMQGGIFFVRSTTQITQTDTLLHIVGDTISKGVYFQSGYAFYIGGTLKLYLFKNAYFTPALNFYIDKYSGDGIEKGSIAIGPSAAFEYFVTDRFSLRLDFFNVNIGVGSSGKFPLITTHRVLGLGLRYSFDTKKVSSE